MGAKTTVFTTSPGTFAVTVGVVAIVAAMAGCNAKKGPPAGDAAGSPVAAPTTPAVAATEAAPAASAAVDAGGPAVATGTYKCTSYIYSQYGGGSLVSAGYNLVVGPGNSYRSSMGGDSPGRIQFSDASHFTFVGGFLDGESGDYVPGPTGHIDYHPPDNSGRFGCYP